MCQLTFVNIPNNKNLSKLILMNQLLFNSTSLNKDGYGIFQEEGRLFKSEKTPNDIVNLGEVINGAILNTKPILGHVRQATIQTGKKEKEINKDNSHPFEYQHLILAHNGSLEIEDKDLESEYKKYIDKKIDSEIFTMELNNHYRKNLDKDFPVVFNEVNKKFTGKFAFVIFNKYENKWYIIRGLQAKLHLVYFKENGKTIGYMVNTEEKSLVSNLDYTMNLIQLVYSRHITYTSPQILAFETIFEARRDNLYEVAKTKETIKTYNYWPNRVYEPVGNRNNSITVFPKVETLGDNESKFLNEIMIDFVLSIEEINRIFETILSSGVNRFNKDEFEIFVDNVVPVLEEYFDADKAKLWRKIDNKGHISVLSIYNKHNLLFPYFFNDIKVLEKIADTGEVIQ